MNKLVNYEEFQRELERLKRERWAKILASEPPGRVPGRRPRDPEKERILLKMDRARLAREQGLRPTESPLGDGAVKLRSNPTRGDDD